MNLNILLLKSARAKTERKNFSAAFEDFIAKAVDSRDDEKVKSSRDRGTATSKAARIGGLLAAGLVATAVAHGRTGGSPTCATADLINRTPDGLSNATRTEELPSLPTYEEVFQHMAECPDPEIESLTFADSVNHMEAAEVDAASDVRASAPAPNLPELPRRKEPAITTLADVERALDEAARFYRLDPQLLWAVAVTESGLRPDARSSAGAVGVMQLMPATAARYNVSNPYDPTQNIMAGARHLRYLIDYYDGDIVAALAAYNAGEGAVDAYRRGIPLWDETRRRWINPQGKVLPIPPYAETVNYVRKIVALWQSGDAQNKDQKLNGRRRAEFASARQIAQQSKTLTPTEQVDQQYQTTKSIPVPKNDDY